MAVVRVVVVERPVRVHAADEARDRRVRGAQVVVPVLGCAQRTCLVLTVADGLRGGAALAAGVVAEHGKGGALRDAVLCSEADLCLGQEEYSVRDGLGAASVHAGLCYGERGVEYCGEHLRREAGEEACLIVVLIVVAPHIGVGGRCVCAVLGLIPRRARLVQPLAEVGEGIPVVAVSPAVTVAVAALLRVEAGELEDVRRNEGDRVRRVPGVVLVAYLPDDRDAVVGRAGVFDLCLYGQGAN